jgi:quercetin dioxygenase-like cupin family protein
LLPDGTEGVLIHTRKGAIRGGHFHDKPESSLLLSGKMKYWKMVDGKREVEFVHGPGQLLHNKPGEAHLALALEEGWLFDWKIGAKAGETTTTNYPRYRKIVENQTR